MISHFFYWGHIDNQTHCVLVGNGLVSEVFLRAKGRASKAVRCHKNTSRGSDKLL